MARHFFRREFGPFDGESKPAVGSRRCTNTRRDRWPQRRSGVVAKVNFRAVGDGLTLGIHDASGDGQDMGNGIGLLVLGVARRGVLRLFARRAWSRSRLAEGRSKSRARATASVSGQSRAWRSRAGSLRLFRTSWEGQPLDEKGLGSRGPARSWVSGPRGADSRDGKLGDVNYLTRVGEVD